LVAQVITASVVDWHPEWVDEPETSHETSFWLETLGIIAQARSELAD
jgi:hypothetical protein